MKYTIPTFNPAIEALVEKRIKEIAEFQTKSDGAIAVVNYTRGYSVLVNSKSKTNFAVNIAPDLMGKIYITENDHAIATSEDYSFMRQKCKGSYADNGLADVNSRSTRPPMISMVICSLSLPSYWVKLVESHLI